MKVLILGHNPFNWELPNGRTLSELFSGFGKEELAVFYIHPDYPRYDVCSRYFRITDSDVLYSILGHRSSGREITQIENQENNAPHSGSIYQYGSRRRSYTVFLRNLLWKIGKWDSPELDHWIEEFHPDVLFFYMTNYSFLIDVCERISEKFGLPVVNYIVDDYYFNRNLKTGIFGGFNQRQYDKKLCRLLQRGTNICLNDLMAHEYEKSFHCKFHVLYTGSSLKPFDPIKPDGRIRMSYLGGVACERYKSLADIGKVIDELDLPIDFSIYTREKREWLISPLRSGKGLTLCDGLDYEGVIRVMENSHVLVAVEGFSKEAQDLVRLSLSTKIADSLSCGRCLLAYEPRGIASMEYLISNRCALVATSYEELCMILNQIASNPPCIDEYRERALAIAQKNHMSENNHEALMHILT